MTASTIVAASSNEEEHAQPQDSSVDWRFLRRVLHLTQPLQRTLSLRQLVPVYAAFLDEAEENRSNKNSNDDANNNPPSAAASSSSTAGLLSFLQTTQNNAERLWVLQYWLVLHHGATSPSSGPQAGILLLLQRLTQIVLPMLLGIAAQQYYDETTATPVSHYNHNNDKKDSGGGGDVVASLLLLLDAVLDALLLSSWLPPVVKKNESTDAQQHDEPDDDNRKLGWSQCWPEIIRITTTVPHNNNNTQNIIHPHPHCGWALTCRLLQRLYHHWTRASSSSLSSSHPECSSIRQGVVAALAEQVVGFVKRSHSATSAGRSATNSSSNSSSSNQVDNAGGLSPFALAGSSASNACWYRSLTHDVLPCLVMEAAATRSKEHEDCFLKDIWKALFETDSATAVSEAHLLASTTILCSLLPSFLDRDLPVYSVTTMNVVDENETIATVPHCRPPLYQLTLWNLIYTCLGQGILHARDGTATTATTTPAVHPTLQQLLRRRGLYLLRVLVEQQHEPAAACWNKYVACFETLEMESEVHLIDQIWETVTELFDLAVVAAAAATNSEADMPPVISWDWMQLLLGRALIPPPPSSRARDDASSAMLRKFTLFRLLKGQAGIRIGGIPDDSPKKETEPTTTVETSNKTKNNNIRSNKKKKNPNIKSSPPRGAPLQMVTVDLIFSLLIPSYDSLLSSVGTNMQTTHAVANLSKSSGDNSNNSNDDGGGSKKKLVAEDMDELLSKFIGTFLESVLFNGDEEGLEDFCRRLWSTYMLDKISKKMCVRIFETMERELLEHDRRCGGGNVCQRPLLVSNDMLLTVAHSIHYALVYGSVPSVQKETLLRTVATMLAHSRKPPGAQYTPKAILSVLALYPLPNVEGGNSNHNYSENDDAHLWIKKNDYLSSLRNWLEGNTEVVQMGAPVATAFVDGFLQSSSNGIETTGGDSRPVGWDPKNGCTSWERSTAKAVSLLCILPGLDIPSQHNDGISTASELLWPAIAKGLSRAPAAMIGTSWTKADCVSRALLLLEIGCQQQVLSGMGNGTLVVDKRSQQMMPPPPNIESILANGASFIFHHIRSLMIDNNDRQAGRASRSSDARIVASTFARLVAQLEALSKGFLASMSISTAVDEVLDGCMNVFASSRNAQTDDNPVLQLALLYTSLSSGGEIDSEKALLVSATVLKLEFSTAIAKKMGNSAQALRSIFQYIKWGALSLLLPKMMLNDHKVKVKSFVDDLFDEAADAVESAPGTAIVPLFNCLVAAARSRFTKESFSHGQLVIPDDVRYLNKIVTALFGLVEESESTSIALHMIDEICALIFQPALLYDEYLRLQDDSGCDTPIRDAFRRFVKMAGTQRPHISRVVLSRICASWLRVDGGVQHGIGLSAIPYREDLVNLLVHKEEAIPLASAVVVQGDTKVDDDGNALLQLLESTDDTSISRGFLLVFLSKLPDINSGLPALVLKDLLHFVIKKLLDKIPASGKGTTIMFGTDEYVRKMRSLQALCVMSRFITSDVASFACKRIYEAMDKGNAHNQIRYFVEILALQCSRKFPTIFGKALADQITRTDLSLQMVASLMIISGNLIVGRYQNDFILKNDGEEGKAAVNLHHILSGAIPWLSSTQGFSRAIAQLLTYKLIPMVIDVGKKGSEEDSDWYLRSIYRFLDENAQMKRLRSKQAQFFEEYEVDPVCTPEGVFSIPVDVGQEADPVHMIEVIKECLVDTYDDADIGELPMWKQIENATVALNGDQVDDTENDIRGDPILNFQRKIIPLDALNLALEDMKERKLQNAAGRRKQQLIVCASLIDKVPNLGGLARTSEIFAANRLVLPDAQVAKMDNFKSLSASAGDWIEIEECKEKDLLEWLRERRGEGYHVVGLEQTSSSVSLGSYTFPNQPTVLLLGKEKEGIPVEFLQAVDQCLEIPQLGLIRSLNVHVSGAIAIWEFTKQQQLKAV